LKLAVVLFNLGGPDSPEAVEPFLNNLFSDPAILGVPAFVRKPLARFIAQRRAPVARAIYDRIGGRSPILEETEKQARALEDVLAQEGHEARAFVAMRCWKPFSDEAARAVKRWGAEQIVLLPLYPQFSTTTSGSSLQDWKRAADDAGLAGPTSRVCCYPWEEGFVAASAATIRGALAGVQGSFRLLLSAHGLPERTVRSGDPYRWQVERTASAIVGALAMPGLDWQICYQSRVGPLKWIGPATDAEIRRAGAEGKSVIVAPIAFVSEHSETLVELDLEYAHIAREAGVPVYRRATTVSHHAAFIAGLARLVGRAAESQTPVTCGTGRICPVGLERCGFGLAAVQKIDR
jgi:ferrochelatase